MTKEQFIELVEAVEQRLLQELKGKTGPDDNYLYTISYGDLTFNFKSGGVSWLGCDPDGEGRSIWSISSFADDDLGYVSRIIIRDFEGLVQVIRDYEPEDKVVIDKAYNILEKYLSPQRSTNVK